MEAEGADEADVLTPVPIPKIFGIVDDGADVEIDDGSCGGFANENGEREPVEDVVMAGVHVLEWCVDGVAVGIEMEGSEKPAVVVEAVAMVPFVESMVLGGVAMEKVAMGELLCGVLSSDFPSEATAGARVSVIVGTDNGLVPTSGAVTLVGISTDFWGGA
jgi:hypothetical protein